MKRLLRFLKRAVIVLAVLLVTAVSLLYLLSERELRRRYDIQAESVTLPTDPASLARGKHVAEHIAGCRDCHGTDFGGHLFFDGGFLMARLPAPNLTRGRGGIGSTYTDADWARAVRHGIRPDGTPLIFMPAHEFAKLPAPDFAALVAYVKTVAPVDRDLPARTAGPIGRFLVLWEKSVLPVRVIDHAKAAPAAFSTDLVARGDELTSVAGCKSCHSPDFTGGHGPPPGAANLTPIGIGHWTRDDFVRTLRTGRTPDQRTLSESMPRALGNLTDDELEAIWAYLQTLPAKGEKSPRQRAGNGTGAKPSDTARNTAATAGNTGDAH